MRVAGAWCAAGTVVAGGLAPLLVTDSAPPMTLGRLGPILFLLVRGSMTYGWRGAPGFFACAYPVAFAFEAPAIATGFPFGFFTHDGPGPEILGVPPTVPPWPSRSAVPAWPMSACCGPGRGVRSGGLGPDRLPSHRHTRRPAEIGPA